MINGIQIGNVQDISNQGSSSGTAPGTHRYALLFCPTDEIGNDEKITGETHVGNDLKLLVQALSVLLRVNVTAGCFPVIDQSLQPGMRFPVQPACLVKVFRHRELRQVVIVEFQLKVTASGNIYTVLQGFRQVMK